ncbi:hypothetical protein PInf_007203 [Phytophthora infestans]|nr:hypothetical protein PInf_007203 [Phytophthora infestans]
MDFIHSKKRNKLTTEKVDMLAYIYVNHHAAQKEAADWARLHHLFKYEHRVLKLPGGPDAQSTCFGATSKR